MLALASMVCSMAQDVPAPSKTKNEGPSLEATMKFLQDKLPGKVNLIVYGHNSLDGSHGSHAFSSETSNVSASADRCRIDHHWLWVDNGEIGHDRDAWILLKQVREIVVMPEEELLKEIASNGGHPEMTYKADPPVFNVVVRSPGSPESPESEFDFYDEGLARRVAKALQHAVELCGGGHQGPL
jgi:hypothetical protein